MLRTEITRLDLRLRRRSLIAYSLGLAAYTLLIVALYPSFKHDNSFDQLTKSNPTLAAMFGATGSITSPTGWMNANLYANFLPLFALLVSIGYGAATIAGQAEDGTLGGIASLPISRATLLAQKVLALALVCLPVPVVSFAATAIGKAFGVELPIGALFQTTLMVAAMSFDFGLIALAVGTATRSRAVALGVTATIATAAYVVSSLAGVVWWIHDLRYVSPIYWSVGESQIRDGATPLGAFLVVVLGAALAAWAYAAIRRFDIP